MSVDQHIALALRKERILLQCARQREQLAQYGAWLKKPCSVGDKLVSAGHYAKAHPWSVGVAVGVAALLGRRYVFRVARYSWLAWRAWRFVDGWVRSAGLDTGLINRLKK